MKTIIFGGAFNPVHKEHINIARSAMESVGADRLIIVPTGTSPHKDGKLPIKTDFRIKACEIAFSSIKNASVSTYEIDREGVSYSYLTCQYFKEKYPDDQLYFLIGADMLNYFPKWKNPEKILNCVTLIACRRSGIDAFDNDLAVVQNKFNCKVEVADYVGLDVSSTKIRTLLALGESAEKYVGEEVYKYLKEKGAYLLENVINAKNFMTEKRWQHSVRVAILCAQNCDRVGLSERDAITLGALHDVAKYLPLNSAYLGGFCKKEGVPAPVLHQYTGAYVVKNTFGITDQKLLSAIECHTSAKANMTDVDILLYLADLLEEERNFKGVDELRQLFKIDLKKCITVALEKQIDYLCFKGADIYHETLDAYKYFKGI